MSEEFRKRATALGMKFCAPLAHPSTVNAPSREYKAVTKDDLDIEYDVAVPTRYDNHLFADIFRPRGSSEQLTPLTCYVPYGKQQRHLFSDP